MLAAEPCGPNDHDFESPLIRPIKMNRLTASSILGFVLLVASLHAEDPSAWEAANPVRPLPEPPLGIGGEKNPPATLSDFENPPTPESVRLGRWLFFDKRLSADNQVSCATCHRPENGFSEPTPVSTGIDGKKGARKAPSFLNQAWNNTGHFFWDGRAGSLEEQAGGPMINAIEMGNKDHEAVIAKLRSIKGYAKYFEEAFGSSEVTIDRVTKAIADYERTRMSGNSAWDRFMAGDRSALSSDAKKGRTLFFGNGFCNNCHKGPNLTDNDFHNLGVGWDEETKTFADEGRYVVTNEEKDKGAFKTPGLRDVSKRAPYMHDGSVKTLAEVVKLYSKGGIPNPQLDRKIDRRFAEQLDFNDEQVQQLVAFMEALDGEGYQDTAPTSFPQ